MSNPRWTAESVAALAAAIREEAKHYPSTDDCEDRCGTDEDVCMEANIHQAWSTNGNIGAVYASPERLAQFALAALADAGLLLPPGGVEREESRVVYTDGRGQDVVWSHASTASVYSGDTQMAVARKEGWPGARLQFRRITEWPDGSQRISDWIEVPTTERTPQ